MKLSQLKPYIPAVVAVVAMAGVITCIVASFRMANEAMKDSASAREQEYEQSMRDLYSGWMKLTGKTNITFNEWVALRRSGMLDSPSERRDAEQLESLLTGAAAGWLLSK